MQNFVFDIVPDSFNAMVLENSAKGPVLLFHWSENAGPCMKLLPRLVRLADQFAGRFLLTLLDTDRFKSFSNHKGVLSIPTVQIYFQGNLVETIHGAYSEKHFHAVIERAVAGKGSPRARQETISGLSASEHAGYRMKLDRAKQYVQNGDVLKAAAILDQLPPRAMQDPEIELVYTHLELLRMAQLAPPMETLERRCAERPGNARIQFQIAARHLVEDNFEPALGILNALQKAADVADSHRATRAKMAIFALLGEFHPLVKKYG